MIKAGEDGDGALIVFGAPVAQEDCATQALQAARDIYTRRGEGVSIWVMRSSDVVASSPDEKDPFFDPALDKAYRHPTFYVVPEGVEHL